MNLPDRHNVFGLLECTDRIEELAQCLQVHMGFSDSEVWVKTSGFNGAKSLIVRAERADFDAYYTGDEGELLFNGAIAGSPNAVLGIVEKLHAALKDHGFKPRFEIYNDDNLCVAELAA